MNKTAVDSTSESAWTDRDETLVEEMTDRDADVTELEDADEAQALAMDVDTEDEFHQVEDDSVTEDDLRQETARNETMSIPVSSTGLNAIAASIAQSPTCIVCHKNGASLQCYQCKQPRHLQCTRRYTFEPLQGDFYYRYHCPVCRGDENTDQLWRLHLAWSHVIQILLSHLLWTSSDVLMLSGHPFVHWQQLCQWVEKYWHRFWRRQPNSGWQNALANALSAGYQAGKLLSGNALFQKVGYWSLERLQWSRDKRQDRATVFIAVDPFTGWCLEEEKKKPVKKEKELDKVIGSTTAIETALEADKSLQHQQQPRSVKRQKTQKWQDMIYWNTDFDRPNVAEASQVTLCKTFSAPQLRLFDQQLAVTTEKGYRMAKATHGVMTGHWYFEVEFTSPGHARIGWSQILGDPQASCGYDEYSYGWRDKDGAIMHVSRSSPYVPMTWQSGDVLGASIYLPEMVDKSATKASLLNAHEQRFPPLRLASQYKIRQRLLPKSHVRFWFNGKPLPIAFEPLYYGKYYPAVSVYGGATCRVRMDSLPRERAALQDPDLVAMMKPMSEALSIIENFDDVIV